MSDRAFVVFLRGVNVGGHKTFRPSLLAKELAALDVTSVGAAGTFVVRRAASAEAVRVAIVERLAFEASVMVCPAGDVLALVDGEPFGSARQSADHRRFVSVLEKAPRRAPRLPIERPEEEWQVRVVRLEGRFALSLWRRVERGRLYPNEVVEATLGLGATTRAWDTIAKIARQLRG
jgi:uncharacterized protein (DUF1697 family)